MKEPWIVLVAGPYRSGTGDDPQKIAENLARLEAGAWEVWQRGHVPVIGEWLALPLVRRSGLRPEDEGWQTTVYGVAHRLLGRCDAVLRLPGASRGADADVALAQRRGLPVVTSALDLPLVRAEGSL